MKAGEAVHEINPSETYQIDSSEYDSDEERDNLADEEYDKLVEEAENGFTEEEVQRMTHELKEKGIINFLRGYLSSAEGEELAPLRKMLLGFGMIPPAHLRHASTPNLALLPFAKVALSRILRRRSKLPQYNTVQDAIHLLRTSRKIIVLSGAGISTSCGIPDFRSAGGLYAQLQDEGKWELDDPQQMFDIHFFQEHPEVFYSFAKQIYPSNFVPSPCHRWIKLLEDKGILLRNYTQNIDTLESLAGVTKVLQCHGSFATASCLRCKTRSPGPTIEPYIMAQQIPYCGPCRQKRNDEIAAVKARQAAKRKEKGKGKAKGWGDGSEEEDSEIEEWGGGLPGIIKPDITFFGQALDSEFDESLYKDREEVDLLVIIGTSLKVAPVSEVLTHIPHSVPQIFINLTPISHVQPDICLLGDADTIVTYLSRELGWEIPPPAVVTQSADLESKSPPVTVVKDEGTEKGTEPPQQITRVPKKINLDDLEWVSAVGELSHVHFLKSSAEVAELLSAQLEHRSVELGEVHTDSDSEEGGVEGDAEDEGSEGASPAVARLDISAGTGPGAGAGAGAGAADATDGYLSDDEADQRPFKRAKGDE